MESTLVHDALLVAELNDLLALDYDALAAYDVAIGALRNPAFQEQIRSFRRDHERHVAELVPLIRERGGMPLEMPHLPTGLFKLAMQKAGQVGGDRGVLLAFKANERQVRDSYLRAAERHRKREDTAVSDVVGRASVDESTHYRWALERLELLGAGPDTTLGRVEGVVETMNAALVDTVEGVEKGALAAGEALRRAARRQPAGAALVAAAVGVGLVAAALAGRRRRM